MKPSEKAYQAIKNREKLRLNSYKLPNEKHYTIGWGHYCDYSDPRNRQWDKPGARITQAQADALLSEDVAKKTKVLNSVIKVPVAQNLYDALASTTYQYNPNNKTLNKIFAAVNLGKPLQEIAKMIKAMPGVLYNQKARKVDAILATTGEVKHIDTITV